MDDLKDIINELKNRLTNPFIVSFLIAWVIFNWYIPLTLLFYDQSQLKVDGNYSSYKGAIISQIDVYKNLVYPFCCAVGYVLIMPIFRGAINLYQAKISVFFENKVIEETNKITPIVAQLQKKDDIIEKINGLYDTLRNEAESLRATNATNANTINALQHKSNDEAIVNEKIYGIWNVKKEINLITFQSVWVIKTGEIIERTESSEKQIYQIVKAIGFGDSIILKLRRDTEMTILTLTSPNNNFDFFTGEIDKGTVITLERR